MSDILKPATDPNSLTYPTTVPEKNPPSGDSISIPANLPTAPRPQY